MTTAIDPVEVARRIADDVLFPAALATDASDAVPREHFDLLAEAGLYGIFAPRQIGGLEADGATTPAVVEVLAAGCLATTFVWIQHFGLLGTMLGDAPSHLRDGWLIPLCRGERRGGLALVGLMPGPPLLRARPDGDSWILDGTAPWVSGWGLVDALLVVARAADESAVSVVLDAEEQDGLTVTRARLVGVDASVTVQLDFDGVRVGPERLISVAPPAGIGPRKGGLRVNGSLALGVAGRCCQLMGSSPLDAELIERRRQLDEAEDDVMPQARAAAAELAMRAATALLVHTGSRGILSDQHAQRLAREALFLLVFGTRPPIKASLLERLLAPR